MSERASRFQRMSDLRGTDKHTNGIVIKPFKSISGAKTMFIVKERVSVQKSGITNPDGDSAYYVTGVAYDVDTGTFAMKVGLILGDAKLARYVKMTGEFVVTEEPKQKTYVTKFRARRNITTLDGGVVPEGTEITKTQTMFETAIESETVEADGRLVLVEGEKLANMCEIIEPIKEISNACDRLCEPVSKVHQ